MAGIVGVVGGRITSARLREAALLLCHGPGFSVRCYTAGRVGLAAAYRENDPPTDVWLPEAGLGVVVYGAALNSDANGGRVDAAAVAARFLTSGLESVCELDGTFVIAILDRVRRKLHFVNDRTATLPVKYHAGPGRFVVAPEAKTIHAALQTAPELDPVGILAFLLAGHGLGWGTMFKGIRLLEPAMVLTVDLDTAAPQRRKYWTLRFQPGKRLGEAAAAAGMHEALLKCHAAVALDTPAFIQLLLTGGYDSRAVLGYLGMVGRPPSECLTWGVSDALPQSDPLLAREMAATQGVPWRFLPYNADHFGENLRRWVAISEADSDNFGNYAAGHDFLYRCGAVAPVMLIGDQLLGTGGLPWDRADAFENLIGVPPGELGTALTRLLRPEARPEAASRLWDRAWESLAGCAGDSPKDIQDHLNLHVRVARWLNAPTYFREPMVSPRRPMLLRPALEYYQTLPAALRVEKRVLIAVLKRYHSRLFAFPKAAAHSLVDWSRAFTDPQSSAGRALRDLLGSEEVFNLPIGAWVDPPALVAAREGWFGRVAAPVNRSPQPERVLATLRRLCGRSLAAGRAFRWAERKAQQYLGRRCGPGQGTVLARLGLVVALRRELRGKWFQPCSGSPAEDANPSTHWPDLFAE